MRHPHIQHLTFSIFSFTQKNQLSTDPVSYTHLDVYKRQVRNTDVTLNHNTINIVKLQSYRHLVHGKRESCVPTYICTNTELHNVLIIHFLLIYFVTLYVLTVNTKPYIVLRHHYYSVPTQEICLRIVSSCIQLCLTSYYPTPVSYTHLDVYKRQVWYRPVS